LNEELETPSLEKYIKEFDRNSSYFFHNLSKIEVRSDCDFEASKVCRSEQKLGRVGFLDSCRLRTVGDELHAQ